MKGFQDTESGLEPRYERFAALIASGLSQADAYREAIGVSKHASQKSVYERASQLAKRTDIKSRVRELLRDARLEDIHGAQQWYKAVLDDIELAREKGNMTAVFSGQRLIGQAINALKDGQTTVHIESVPDEQLIKRIAQTDPRIAERLKSVLTGDSFTKGTA